MLKRIHFPSSGLHEGDFSLTKDMDFCGLVLGSVTVPPGKTLRLYGKIAGDLIVQKDAQAAIYGTIAGAVLNHGAKVNILGRAGSVRDLGGCATWINDRAAMGFAAPAAMDPAPVEKSPPPEMAPPPAVAPQKPVSARTRRPLAVKGGRGKRS